MIILNMDGSFKFDFSFENSEKRHISKGKQTLYNVYSPFISIYSSPQGNFYIDDDQIRKLFWKSGYSILLKSHAARLNDAADGIQADIQLIEQAASGQCRPDQRNTVQQALQNILDALHRSPGNPDYQVPVEWYSSTDLGRLSARTQLWLDTKILITLKEAAYLLYGDLITSNLVGIHQAQVYVEALTKGGRGLSIYLDMSEPNPRLRKRIDKYEIEQRLKSPQHKRCYYQIRRRGEARDVIINYEKQESQRRQKFRNAIK